jgi:hypothetical protein
MPAAETVRTALVITIVLLVGVVLAGSILSSSAASGGGQAFSQTSDAEITGGTGTLEKPAGSVIDNRSNTTLSLEDAIKLNGAPDSRVDIQTDASVSGDRDLCTIVALDPDELGNIPRDQVIAQAGDLIVHYNESNNEYQAWYYDATTRGSNEVSVAAPTPTNPTLVCGQVFGNGGGLTIFRNTTQGTSAVIDGTSTEPAPVAGNLDGLLEETRLYPDNLNTSQRADLDSQRVQAVTGITPTFRVAYDTAESSPSQVDAYFTTGDALLDECDVCDWHQRPGADSRD